MFEKAGKVAFKNIPNVVSILGVLPLALLYSEDGYQYIIPLIIYNNVMDDLDGILAGKLGLRSDFGAYLDNVIDAVAHTIFVMVVGMHFGWICGSIGLIAVVSILIRAVSRLTCSNGNGSPTNELIRHVFFVLLVAEIFGFVPIVLLMMVFLIHAISMIWPYPMPYMIRIQAKTGLAICIVNVFLIVAWLVPYATPMIAGCFILTYLYSFIKAIPKMKAG